MKHETAERLLDAIVQLQVPHLMIRQALHEIEDDEERDEQLDHLAKMLSSEMAILSDMCGQYPEFDPIGKGEELWFQLRKKYETTEFPATRETAESRRAAAEAGRRAAAEILAENPHLKKPDP